MHHIKSWKSWIVLLIIYKNQYSVDGIRLQSEMQTLKRTLNIIDASQSEKKKKVSSALCVRNYFLEMIH